MLAQGKPTVRHYNVIVLEYPLSHFSLGIREKLADELFSQLIKVVLSSRLDNSPFLFIINDIDHDSVRSLFDILLNKLDGRYQFLFQKGHFKRRGCDYYDDSVLYPLGKNKFRIPDELKYEFNCAIICTSAQLIVEVQ